MRFFLAAVCYLIEIASMITAGFFTYLAVNDTISFDLALFIFIPLMIVSYWFSTFFYQLTNLKTADGGRYCIVNKWVRKILSFLSTFITVALLTFWVIIFLWQNGYIDDIKLWRK